MRRLIAVLLALVVGGAGVGSFAYRARAGAGDTGRPGAYPTSEQVTNFPYMLGQYERMVEQGRNPIAVFGSSELNAAPAGPAHPGDLLAPGRSDVSVMACGRAGCIDLWQAIEVGAFAGHLQGKRIVLIPSIQWFMSYRRPDQDFPATFSQGAFEAFMANVSISDGVKRRVVDRMREYGVERGESPLPWSRAVDAIDCAVASTVESARLACNPGAAAAASDASGPSGSVDDAGAFPRNGAAPNWERVFSQADRYARAACGSNELGLNDRWYKQAYEKWVAGANKNWKVKQGQWFSEQEYEDFQLVLDVCREAGLEPLVLMQPVKGTAYDRTPYDRAVRAQWYGRMRELCREAGVAIADFSSHEYDTYFLREYSHPSGLGGAYYAQAIYSFAKTGEAVTGDPRGVSKVRS